ncbi:WecB/TagA/CpsF family glycosyltransferase [Neptunomonas japonica]|uniref:N-acetylglucosaminyldiphosphoundecaprenol N-acetyl-beta-D-mannosaminyltransferase n=1 Tax=Neptunomonas japonica JAMM 1380 TaxID=1441457 RepID=A0A7R6SVM2_9GAMM|nr:WecB/TagA/CpsF family glycosyltransferase [Neptunomonas japonica]BBB28875.1 N-acetylglucosaminyldiphosphoundecaprenol N-acetyl-beta-D-mannosaminyltransferase [Neptunomonas japonica JAMM 1380]
MNRINFLGSPMDSGSMSDTVSAISERILSQQFTQHVVVNVAKLVNMRKDPELAKSVTECDIINIDGMGVVWGARFLGHNVGERVSGVDLFAELNAMAEREGFPVFYLGAKEEVVTKTGEVMQAQHPQLTIAGTHHGYFWDDEQAVVEQIKASGARLLFVAITSPKKENFINRWKDELGVDFVMGVGGTFDVVAGKVSRAPVWMQKYGLEWLYRVIQEPRRMWKRYLVTNSQFAWLLVQAKLGFLKDTKHNNV